MELWAIITIGSAFLQNVRSTLQKHLKGQMGTTGATFVRFGFGLPFALIYLAVLNQVLHRPLPIPGVAFVGWALAGALAQIAATFLLVHIFSYRNFAVGTAYSRTEPAQAALIALLWFSETVSPLTIGAILLSIIGVMLISVARTTISPRSLIISVTSRTATVGLGSGFFFGISGISYRAASLSLEPSLPAPDTAMQASFTLVVVIFIQTVSMLAWMVLYDPEELVRVRKAWRTASLVGFVGATASFGWFAAMTLQQVAVVKALAQVEMLFTFASSVLIFKEKINRVEVLGCIVIVAGVLLLLLG
ncbi:EamA family transporter [Peteryoungia desertarenae]|uniref:EamA family transporter n=1 Tax=Peteryoungia desertarenae TaxID=1813451 RepID=A0ABX6QMB6_9HYPH|nr:DMT family transporter [Peteryoungia desertarenae]QLF69235.1 EamA family transporter [Peteryoungia desertarenae]